MIASNWEHYYVINENFIGLIRPGQEYPKAEIIATSIIRGGPGPLDGVRMVNESDIVRPVTLVDFETFRCHPPSDFPGATPISKSPLTCSCR